MQVKDVCKWNEPGQGCSGTDQNMSGALPWLAGLFLKKMLIYRRPAGEKRRQPDYRIA